MKKIILTLCLSIMSTMLFAAPDVKPRTATLDFTLNYHPSATLPSTVHIMKNTVVLENKWVVAGKLNAAKSDESLLFLVRLLSHRNNKYNLQFMLVDLNDHSTYIAEPRLAAIVGLPVKLNHQVDGKIFELNALVKLVAK